MVPAQPVSQPHPWSRWFWGHRRCQRLSGQGHRGRGGSGLCQPWPMAQRHGACGWWWVAHLGCATGCLSHVCPPGMALEGHRSQRGHFEAGSKKGCITSWVASHSKTLIQPKAQGSAKPPSHMLPRWGSGGVSMAGAPILPHRHQGSGPQKGSSVILVSPGTSTIWVLPSPPGHPVLQDPSLSLSRPQEEVWLGCRQVA